MSYQVLARKYRPASFHEMVGQTHVLQALINALDSQRLHHAYLFTGTRGVGKTSIARILAKCLNCEVSISAKPCGVCNACQEISQGRFVDLIEVDAASRTRVEDTRELLDNVQYAPTKGRFKIYLIDEVHMLSTHSFNALLKTLEEPPEHVKFLLATTDPQKLPVTILSRCLQFNLKNLSTQFIAGHLQALLSSESIDATEDALWSIATAAKGSMRDALSLTDQAIAFCSGDISQQSVSTMLGTIDQQKIHQLLSQLIEHNAEGLLNTIQQISEFSPDYTAILDAVLYGLHQLTLAQIAPKTLSDNPLEQAFLIEQAAKISAEELQLFYQMGLLGKKDLPFAPDPQSGLEMALLRMLTFRPRTFNAPFDKKGLSSSATETSVSQSSENNRPADTAENNLSASPTEKALLKNNAQSSVSSSPYSHEEKKTPTKESISLEQEDSMINRAQANTSATEIKAISPVSACNDATAEPQPTVSPSNETVISIATEADQPDIAPNDNKPSATATQVNQNNTPTINLFTSNEDWLQHYQHIEFTGLSKAIARQIVLAEINDQHLLFMIDPNHAHLFNDNHLKQIEANLINAINCPLSVSIEIKTHTLMTPDAFLAERHHNQLAEAKASIYNDKQIQSIVERFDAQIDDNSIQYIKRK